MRQKNREKGRKGKEKEKKKSREKDKKLKKQREERKEISICRKESGAILEILKTSFCLKSLIFIAEKVKPRGVFSKTIRSQDNINSYRRS